MNDLLIIIPALNESETISGVIEDSFIYGDILVVNDGSTDNTEQLVKLTKAKLLNHQYNMGYDEALKTGLNFALKNKYKFAISIDADNQLPIELIPKFYRYLKEGFDLVIGIRDSRQRWSEVIFSFVGKYLWNLSDPLCGMKGYSLKFLNSNQIDKLDRTSGSGLAVEIKNKGGLAKEINIKTKDRDGPSRFGSGIRVNYRIIASLIKLILKQ